MEREKTEYANFTLRIDRELLIELHDIAEKNGRSLNSEIVWRLRAIVEEKEMAELNELATKMRETKRKLAKRKGKQNAR